VRPTRSTGGEDAPPVEGPLEARLPGDRYGVVLLLLVATFLFMASGPSGHWVPLVTVVLQSATLLATLSAARAGRRLVRVASFVVVVSPISATAATVADPEDLPAALFLLNVLLLAGSPVVIARSILRRQVVDARTVLGALCIYVLIGMLWAFVDAAIGAIDDSPFFAQVDEATTADYLYFSFATQTTVGYGDLSAAGGLGRALAVLEALVAQLYLVTVVGVLVGKLAGNRREPGSA
jgi:hypothetical protein